jgi:hypothetical protein
MQHVACYAYSLVEILRRFWATKEKRAYYLTYQIDGKNIFLRTSGKHVQENVSIPEDDIIYKYKHTRDKQHELWEI